MSYRKERIFAALQICLGCLLAGASYPLFLTPNHIAPGGLAGFATVLNYLFRWPVGTVTLLMNIPLFALAWKRLGHVFLLRSLSATVLLSLFMDLLPFSTVTDDPLLACVFGGVMLGVGLGLVQRAGATNGGTVMAARMLQFKIPFLTVGGILFVIDCLSAASAGLFIEIKYALYDFISIYVADRVLDAVTLGFSREKACYIIAEALEPIKKEILSEMHRGATILSARGGYSGADRPVLLCVCSAAEAAHIKQIVRAKDEKAFVFITDAYEVLGNGFSSLKEQ